MLMLDLFAKVTEKNCTCPHNLVIYYEEPAFVIIKRIRLCNSAKEWRDKWNPVESALSL